MSKKRLDNPMNLSIVLIILLLLVFPGYSGTETVQEYKAIQHIKEDGMIFHNYYPPFTQKDREISPKIEEIEQYLSMRDYSKVEKLTKELLKEVIKESPATIDSSSQMYSIYTYRQLKDWNHMLKIMTEIMAGNYDGLQTYTGKIIAIDWGQGKNSSGYIKVIGNEGEREFFGNSDFLIEKGGKMEKGKTATIYYEITKSLDDPYYMIVVTIGN